MPACETCIYWQRCKMNKFEKHILEYIRSRDMIRRGDLILAALSGGPDSVCLLSVLCSLRKVIGFRLSAVHVHHGLRGAEADRDEAFCRELSGLLDVPFDSIRVDVHALVREKGLSEEEAARDLRYGAMMELLEKKLHSVDKAEDPVCAGRIAVAHHADDQAETILLNLLRGSGLKGLCGMQPVRGAVIRPLLETGRTEILQYLDDRGLGYCLDRTNLENDYTRNFLRNEILPRMEQGINRRASQHIAAAGRMIAEAEAFLEETAGSLPGVIKTGSSGIADSVILQRRILKEKPQLLRRYVIIEALKRLGIPLKDWGEAHFAEIDRALSAHAGYHLDLPGGVSAENSREETVIFLPAAADKHIQ